VIDTGAATAVQWSSVGDEAASDEAPGDEAAGDEAAGDEAAGMWSRACVRA